MLTGTPHFSIGEALQASGGTIPSELQDNAQQVLEWLESARVWLGRPILITSLYRSPEHNASVPGHANDSQHMRALGADFDVIGLTNHAALARIVDGVKAGAIPSDYHQLITYATDHHIHVGIAGENWPDDQQLLLRTATGYQSLSDVQLEQLAQSSVADAAVQLGAQAVDAATSYPVVTAALVAVFLVPALFGGHWT